MKSGNYQIAEQHESYGFYGYIYVECEELNVEGLVKVDLDPVHRYWENSVAFGVRYFLEHCSHLKGLSVKVTELKTNEVDSSFILIAFITIKALAKMYDVENKIEVLFDKRSKSFSFRK